MGQIWQHDQPLGLVLTCSQTWLFLANALCISAAPLRWRLKRWQQVMRQQQTHGNVTAEDLRKGSKYDRIKSAGAKKKTMLASEVSYVMSETTAKAGEAFYRGHFLGDCSPQVQKLICPGKQDSEQEIVEQQEVSLKINLVQIANAMQC